MSELDCLRAQARHHYAFLSRAIADVDAESARAVQRPDGPSIAWQVGHCADVTDSVAEAVAGTGRGLPADFGQRHGLAHWGASDAEGWRDLRAAWERTSARTLAGLDALEPTDLEQPPAVEIHPAFGDLLRTRADFLRGHVFHLAYHLGQIGALRAARGLGW